jgi:uncharacterized membrane protein
MVWRGTAWQARLGMAGVAWLGWVRHGRAGAADRSKRKEGVMEAFGFMTIIILIAVSIVLFLVLREFFCWYFKINEHLKKQDEIIELLKTVNKTEEKARMPLNSAEKQVYSETSITKEMIEKLEKPQDRH